MSRLYIDLETRSAADLRKTGVYEYAEHPSTQIILFAWALDLDTVHVWQCLTEPAPRLLLDALRNPAVAIVAHNANFERTMLRGPAGARIGMEAGWFGLRRWNCTAARAACFGLPRTLAGAGKALGLPVQKDEDGHRLMLQMCKPRRIDGGTITWWEDNERMARLSRYCADDVVVERLVDRTLPQLPAQERRLWLLTEAMNDRGIGADTDMIVKAALLVDEAAGQVNKRLALATGGALRRVTDHAAIAAWLKERIGVDPDETLSVARAAVDDMLADENLPALAREVLLLRREGGKSSASKYRALLSRVSPSGRLRGPLVYSGAAATRRWSSRGAQVQNLPRGGAVKDMNGAIRMLLDEAPLARIEATHGPGLVVASEMLRPCFIAPPDAWLTRGDFSQIEARVLPWLAGETKVLDAFRAFDAGAGPDIYKVAAAGIFGTKPENVMKEQRQIGKVAVLALGFQGGKKAFASLAKVYGVHVEEERAEEIKIAWRAANPAIVQFWYDLENAARECMESRPGAVVHAGRRISFRRTHNVLCMSLPAPGARLFYWHPRLASVVTPWGQEKLAVTYMAEDAQTKAWRRFTAYGGLFAENATQATARDVMGEALVALAREPGVRPVLTVHDEGIAEVSKARAPTRDYAARVMLDCMLRPAAWRDGLPIAADASADTRYLKGA